MNLVCKQGNRLFSGIILMGIAIGTFVPQVRANVYATNVRVNGGYTNLTALPGAPITIDYILNEPASLGVSITISLGGNVVRTLALAGNSTGTQQGINAVVWDGLDSHSNTVATGTYSISVSPKSSGYTNWTQIIGDESSTYLYDGHGITVDRNTNSLYYGRVWAANSALGGDPADNYGDNLGLLAFNADSSIADTNIDVTAGYNWSGGDLSPWKVEVSSDDFVYASEAINGGRVFHWDQTLSTNSFLPVLRGDNHLSTDSLNGPLVVGSGVNAQLWMCDANTSGSRGVLRWSLGLRGSCATNDTGTSVVGTTGTLGSTNAPFAAALDPAGNIYICQSTSTPGDPAPRVFRFPAYDPSTNGGIAEVTADWAVGAGDDTYGQANDIAVDPTGTYLAVACQGTAPGNQITNGNTKVIFATNGAVVANIDLGVAVNGDPTHQDTACAWDEVGNLYYIDNWVGQWRVVSPPGTNSSITLALASVQVAAPVRPQITNISVSNTTVTLNFTGSTNDSANAFTLQSAAKPAGPYSAPSGAVITLVGPGVFRATAPVNGPVQFYRLQR